MMRHALAAESLEKGVKIGVRNIGDAVRSLQFTVRRDRIRVEGREVVTIVAPPQPKQGDGLWRLQSRRHDHRLADVEMAGEPRTVRLSDRFTKLKGRISGVP